VKLPDYSSYPAALVNRLSLRRRVLPQVSVFDQTDRHPVGSINLIHPSQQQMQWARRLPLKMTASTRLVGGVTIVDLSGRIVLGEGSALLRDLFRDLVREGNKKIRLNLSDVNYIDSSGLGELVSAFTSMRSQGGELKLLNLTKRVRLLLQVTKLITVFDITDDEAASVKSFSPAIWSAPLLEPSAR